MSKMTTNNSAKKLRLLKYSLLASISAAAIIATTDAMATSLEYAQPTDEHKKKFTSVLSQLSANQTVDAVENDTQTEAEDPYKLSYEHKKNLASQLKRRPSRTKGNKKHVANPEIQNKEADKDFENFFKNPNVEKPAISNNYTPETKSVLDLDTKVSNQQTQNNSSNDSTNETFVTANNTLLSTLSTSFDQMEYKYMALRKDVQTKMDKIDSAIEQSQGNNKKSLKQAKSSLSKKQKAILDAANIEEQIIELKKADSSSREENKIKKLVKELKKSEKKVEKAYSDIETSFNKLKLEPEPMISSGFDTSTVQQEPNSQSDFNPAQASTPKKLGVFSRLFGKGKKDDNTSAEEPKLTKSQEQLQRTKAARQGVADKNKATADEVKRKSAEYQAQIEQDNNERIEKVKVDREAQRKAKEVRRRQAAEAYAAAKKKII